MNMSRDVLGSISALYSCLSPTEKRIADYVLACGNKVLELSVRELASICAVSESSVIRFCRRACQSGYPAFRLALAANLEAERLQGRIPEPVRRQSRWEAPLHAYAADLERARRALEENVADQVAERLVLSRQIYLFGESRQQLLTQFLGRFAQERLGKGVCMPVPDPFSPVVQQIDERDTVVFIVARNGKEFLPAAFELANRNAYLVCLSMGGTSVQRFCQACLRCERERFSPAASSSFSAFFFVWDALCADAQKRAEERR